jgi:hypothetical protein
MIMIVFCYGYTSFAPFSVSDFFIYYTLLLVGKSTLVLPHSKNEQILTPHKQPQSPSSPGNSSNAPAFSSLLKSTWSGNALLSTTTR